MMTVEFIERCHVDQYEFLVSEVDQIVSAKLWVLSSGLEVIKLFSCSTQLSMKF